MIPNNAGTNLVIGLAAVGLTLAVAGVRMYKRNKRERAAAPPEPKTTVEVGSANDANAQAEAAPDSSQALANGRSSPSEEKLLLQFFLLVFLLAVPFWLFGGGKLPLPINLPVSALGTFVPVTAAAIVCYRQYRMNGVKELLKKALDYWKVKNKIWYLPALFLMPLIGVLSYAIMRLAGLPLPDPVEIPLQVVPVFFVMFFIGDIGEELGWTGYAIDPMQNRWGALRAALILGIVWVIWHTIPWVQTGNSANWILWQGLFSIALRVLIVWVYNNTGKSVFAAILVHVASNLSWTFFPNLSSHYDPFVMSLVSWLAVIIILLVWEPKTLARLRAAVASG